MAQVIVRNLDDKVVAALKERAAGKGRALEQELRDILTDAAKPSRAETRRDGSMPDHDAHGPPNPGRRHYPERQVAAAETGDGTTLASDPLTTCNHCAAFSFAPIETRVGPSNPLVDGTVTLKLRDARAKADKDRLTSMIETPVA